MICELDMLFMYIFFFYDYRFVENDLEFYNSTSIFYEFHYFLI